MSLYTQMLARTDRLTQVFAPLMHLDAYILPQTSAGTLICERTSEANDVRIMVQAASGISLELGRGHAVLAIAGDEGDGFWCGLFDGGVSRFEYNRLAGPRAFAEKPVELAEAHELCERLEAGSEKLDAVYAILASRQYKRAVDRHAALAYALDLPAWSPGLGYSRIVREDVPLEAGRPMRSPRSVSELRPVDTLPKELESSDLSETFQRRCRHAFHFLEEELGFWIEPAKPLSSDDDPYVFTFCYRSERLSVLIEGRHYSCKARLILINQDGRLLDFMGLVERRNPELLDLLRLADIHAEQVPLLAEALRTCAADVLAGDLSNIERGGLARHRAD